MRRVAAISDRAQQWAARGLDIVLPPHSLITGHVRGQDETDLWQNLNFLDAPCCASCGYPFAFDQGAHALCGRCHGRSPAYRKARAAIAYDENSRKLVLDFKHGGRTDGLDFFARQMQRAGRTLIPEADILVPVPLHRARLRRRRFNQAALLARALSKRTGLPYETGALLRRKNTPTQGGQSVQGRRRNVAGAFHVPKAAQPKVAGKAVILIDDVQTTGATLEACARILRRAGAAQIDALCLMRVVRAAPIPT